MKQIKPHLLYGLLCIVDAQELAGARPLDILLLKDRAELPKVAPKKPSSFTTTFQHWKDRWNSLKKPMWIKKKPVASPTSLPTDTQGVVLPHPEKLTSAEDIAIQRLAEHVRQFRTHQGTDSEPLSDTALTQLKIRKTEVSDTIRQSTIVESVRTALQPVSPVVEDAFQNFEKVRNGYLDALLSGHNASVEKTGLDESLRGLVEVLKKQERNADLKSIEDPDAAVMEALGNAHFATINDVDGPTKILFRMWNTVYIKQFKEVSVAFKAYPDDPLLYLKLLKAKADLEASTKKLIAGIKTSKQSKAAQENWKVVELFPTLLAKSTAQAKEIKERWQTLKDNPAIPQRMGDEITKLYTSITALQGKTLTFEEMRELSKPHFPTSLAAIIEKMQQLTAFAQRKTKKSFFNQLFS